MHQRINAGSFPSLRGEDLTSSELFDMERQVAATMDTPGWQVILRLVEEAKEQKVFVLTAEPHDHAEMARLAGIIEGTRAAESAAETVTERAEDVRKELDAEAVREELNQLAGSGQEA